MPRNNSTAWNIADPITAARLNQINADVDDLYSTGSDRLKVWALPGLDVEIWAGNYRVGSAEGIFAGTTETLTNNATNYISLTGAGIIDISISWWNTNYLRLAKVITLSGVIISVENWRPDGVGWVLGGGGFKNITSTTYTNWQLTSFIWDGVSYTLTYTITGSLSIITNGANTWSVSYDSFWNFSWLIES
jgi:hypothetical protein